MRGKWTEGDRDILRGMNGMFVGMLDRDEAAAFERLVEAGEARRSYEGVAGGMGLAKVDLAQAHPPKGEG